VLSGFEQYSSFAFASLMSEGSPQFRPLQDFMVQLFGGPSVLTDDDVREALEESSQGITNLDYVVGLLQNLTFLSYETSPGNFVFGYDQEEKAKLTVLARKTAKVVGKKRYLVHPVYHAYLELKSVDATGQQAMLFGRLPN
jgi:hypothetical protein